MQAKPTQKRTMETVMAALGLATAAVLVFGPWGPGAFPNEAAAQQPDTIQNPGVMEAPIEDGAETPLVFEGIPSQEPESLEGVER